MPAVITEDGLELFVDAFLDYEFIDEKFTYSTGTDVYRLSRTATTNGINNIVDASGTTYTKGTDYDELDDSGNGSIDSVEWLSGSTPSDNEAFYVSYTRESDEAFAEKIALGTGTSDVSKTDSSMQSEVNRIDVDAKFADVSESGNRRLVVELTGGTEVPADSDISEFGLFDSNGNMLYHETRDPITIGQGVRQDFFIDIDIDGIRID